jgi:Alpha/beta hydrolase domain
MNRSESLPGGSRAAVQLLSPLKRRIAPAGVALTALLVLVPASGAHVTKIVIEKKVSPAFEGRTFGAVGRYETIAGRAYGELDPDDPHNSVITDIHLAKKNAHGKVEYVASFFLVKPIDMSKASHLMWHDVPNRGGRITIAPAERNFGDIGLSSGWQGDNSGNTVPGPDNDWVTVPIARNADGSAITGLVLGRIVNASGVDSQPLLINSNPVPYKPASLDTAKATLMAHTSEGMDGAVKGAAKVPGSDWAWARCDAAHPFPGTPDPTQICVKGGFDPKLLYQVVFTAQDPYVLGIGFAAFRDVASFFKNAAHDDEGTANPVANQVTWVISRGVSQSGNFLRAFLQLGFNQDESNRKVYDGAWPIIAGRRVALDARFAMPDGASKLYEVGSEGPQSWVPWADPVRGLPKGSVLDRCTASNTCPKIIELGGSAEVWALRLWEGWTGTTGDADIPIPDNVRRYYVPSVTHGGGRGGFSLDPLPPPACPGPSFGYGMFAANPVPYTETMNAVRFHFRNWVMKDTAPPPSKWPRLKDGYLVDPTKQALGFPSIPGVPASAPTGLMNPILDYDWGPQFNYVDGSGVASNIPPPIKRAIEGKAPRVDADGNELGGIPVVLRDAPLGTYLGWNVVADGFHKGKLCNYAGGMISFAKTKAERMANGDPRPSLEERYKSHDGYVQAVKSAAAHAVSEGFLLQSDADALVQQAAASSVLQN